MRSSVCVSFPIIVLLIDANPACNMRHDIPCEAEDRVFMKTNADDWQCMQRFEDAWIFNETSAEDDGRRMWGVRIRIAVIGQIQSTTHEYYEREENTTDEADTTQKDTAKVHNALIHQLKKLRTRRCGPCAILLSSLWKGEWPQDNCGCDDLPCDLDKEEDRIRLPNRTRICRRDIKQVQYKTTTGLMNGLTSVRTDVCVFSTPPGIFNSSVHCHKYNTRFGNDGYPNMAGADELKGSVTEYQRQHCLENHTPDRWKEGVEVVEVNI